jgi:hypothetical protein
MISCKFWTKRWLWHFKIRQFDSSATYNLDNWSVREFIVRHFVVISKFDIMSLSQNSTLCRYLKIRHYVVRQFGILQLDNRRKRSTRATATNKMGLCMYRSTLNLYLKNRNRVTRLGGIYPHWASVNFGQSFGKLQK